MASNIAQAPAKGAGSPAPPATNPSQDRAVQLQKCKILEKLKAGDLASISPENVEELFDVLDQNERGELSHHDLKMLQEVRELQLTDDDIDNLLTDVDKDASGKVSKDELYKAFTQGSIVHKYVLKQLGQGPKTHKLTECDREIFLDYMRDEHETKDALWSLPGTIIMFVIYLLCVTWHLDSETAYSMQSAIQGEVEGEGKPYLGTYVHDVPTFWEWMRSSFVNSHFKSKDDLLGDWPVPGRFASFNQMIGGMQIIKQMSTGEPCADATPLATLYDSFYGPGQCYKGEVTSDESIFFLYHEQLDDMVTFVNGLADDIWVSHNTTMLDFTNLYYNAHLGTWTMFHLTFEFLSSGTVRFLFDLETFQADPYRNKFVIAFDVIFGLFLLKMAYTEAREFIPRMLNGLDGVIQYFEFWNVVDDLAVFGGVTCMALWGMVCTKVGGDLQEKLDALPTKELDNWVLSNQTYFRPAQLEEIIPHSSYEQLIKDVHAVGGDIASIHALLRWVVFFYSAVLMLKFFKGFRANPRLDVVVKTILVSAPDLAHFCIVFGTIFMVFSLMAYVAFGAKIYQFHTQYRSFYMCWRVLLGDFDVDEMDMINLAQSQIWFWGFQILVMLILLNMLLAIIMDTYTGVKTEKENPIEIWNQARLAVTQLQERRGHLPMLYLICEMEDEDQKAHPGLLVTGKSLRKAFERDKMTRHNAEYLIKSAVNWSKEKEAENCLTVADSVRLIGQVRVSGLKVEQNTEKTFNLLKAHVNAPSTQRQDMIMAGIEPDAPVKRQPGMGNTMNMQATNGIGAQPNSVMGVPVNGSFGNPNAPGMYGNQAAMNGNMPMVQAQPMPMQPQQPLSLENRPFNPDMSFHNHHLARTAQNPSSPQAGANKSVSTGPSNGQMNNSFDSMNMSNISAQPGHMSSFASGGLNSPHGGGTSMYSHGGASMSGPGSDAVLNQLAQMQASIDSLQDAVVDNRQYIENRDSWLEQKMNSLDHRCKKVEALSDRLYMLLQEMDVGDLSSVPQKVVHALNTHGGGRGGLNTSGRRFSDGMDAIEDRPGTGEDAEAEDDSAGSAVGRPGSLEHDIHQMSKQVTELLAHAQETTELKKLLWKVDLNVRGIRNAPQNNMEAITALLKQQQDMARQTSEASNQREQRRPSRMPRGSRISVPGFGN